MSEKDIENTQLTTEDFDGTDKRYDEITEEEFENATDAVQVRHLIKMNERSVLRNRDDVTLKFEMKVGVKDTGFDMNDTRRVLKLYKIPDGYWYRLDDEVVGHSEASYHKLGFDVFVEDSLDFVKNATQRGCTIDESVEFTEVSDGYEDLRYKIKKNIVTTIKPHKR